MLLLALSCLLIFCLLILYQYFQTESTITFCNVGQGDATHLRIKNRIDILIDTGTDLSVLSCLGNHMPFYDRTLEFVFITHPQYDHMGSLPAIMQRYEVKRLYLNPVYAEANFFKYSLALMTEKKTKLYFPDNKTEINSEGMKLQFYWPTAAFKKDSLYIPIYWDAFKTTFIDPNDFSFIFKVTEQEKTFLFTGDASPSVLNRLARSQTELYENNLKSTVLKVPHHGSKNGLTENFLKVVKPEYAIISVGAKNRYGHPSDSVVTMLKKNKTKVLRTDIGGEIVFSIKNSTLSLIKYHGSL